MSDLEIEFAWGGAGLTDLHDRCDVFVVLDVLCFTTSVDVAVARGAEVLPFPLGKYGADELARSGEAVLAQPRREAAGGPSLSPASLQRLAPGTRLVLPSPNGSALSTMVRDRTAFAASLRNATAVAAAVQGAGKPAAACGRRSRTCSAPAPSLRACRAASRRKPVPPGPPTWS
jgi:2-phosphosulfolactate phosphatase